MPYTPTLYEEQGHAFELVPTSPFNRKRLKSYFKERNHRIKERQAILEERAEGNFDRELPPEQDQFEMYWDLFHLLTEGPHEELDREHFNEKLGEAALADFMPQAVRTMMEQTGFLPRRGL